MAPLLKQALGAFQSGDFEQAASLARSFLAENPDDPYGVHILASIALVRGMPATCIALIGRILPTLPQEDPFLLGRLYQTLGRALMAEHQLEAARSAFVLSLQYFPEEASAHAGLAETLSRLGQWSEAVASFRQALRLAPREAVLWALLGEAYIQGGQYQQAVSAYGQAQKLKPEESSFYANQGVALYHLSQWEAALDVLEKALSLGNDLLETKLTLALVKLSLGEVAAARDLFEALYREHPDYPALILAYGNFCYETGDRLKAETLFRAAEEQDQETGVVSSGLIAAKAAFNRGAILLERGMWREGWALYERRKAFMPPFYNNAVLLWDGSAGQEPVALKPEGGWGDSLMFLRFLPKAVLKRPLRLDFSSEMLDLLAFMSGLSRDRLVAAGTPVIAEQSLNSLPFILGCSEPENAPYLSVPGMVEPDLVGISWSGNPHYLYDRRRSVPPVLLEQLQTIKGVRFLSLQKEGEVPDWMETAPLETLSDLARALQRCALVISIDSLVANMAGAMGKDLWLLHRLGGDWRWSRHFWYQTVRLFYPVCEAVTSQETWETAFKALGEALSEWAGQAGRPGSGQSVHL